jgi:hypothetical protein
VSVQTLSLALQSQMGSGPDINATGAWAIGTAYVVNDSVTRSGKTYINILANTGSDPATDSAVHWVVIGTGAQPASLLSLSAALVSGFKTMWASRQARREGLLAPLVVITDANDSVSRQASTWAEVVEAENYFKQTQAYDQSLAPLRATDSTGAPLAGVRANVSNSQLAQWGSFLIDRASDFSEVSAEVLPA